MDMGVGRVGPRRRAIVLILISKSFISLRSFRSSKSRLTVLRQTEQKTKSSQAPAPTRERRYGPPGASGLQKTDKASSPGRIVQREQAEWKVLSILTVTCGSPDGGGGDEEEGASCPSSFTTTHLLPKSTVGEPKDMS